MSFSGDGLSYLKDLLKVIEKSVGVTGWKRYTGIGDKRQLPKNNFNIDEEASKYEKDDVHIANGYSNNF